VRTITVETASRFARDLMVQEVGHAKLRERGIDLMAAEAFIDDNCLREWSENFGDARHVLFLLDACFSGLAATERKGGFDPKNQTIQRDEVTWGRRVLLRATEQRSLARRCNAKLSQRPEQRMLISRQSTICYRSSGTRRLREGEGRWFAAPYLEYRVRVSRSRRGPAKSET
jgi:hypothetical protein